MLSSCVAPSCVIKEDPDSDVGKEMELCCVLLWAQLKLVRVLKKTRTLEKALSALGEPPTPAVATEPGGRGIMKR